MKQSEIWVNTSHESTGIHYCDVIMGAIASQITSLTVVYSTVYWDADQRKHQSSASLAFVWGNSPGTGEFPAQMASNAENISIWWRHHVDDITTTKRRAYFMVYTVLAVVIHDSCARSRYQGQGQVIASHSICGMYLLVPALDTCFRHTRPYMPYASHRTLRILFLCGHCILIISLPL